MTGRGFRTQTVETASTEQLVEGNRVKILFKLFGEFRNLVGQDEVVVDVPPGIKLREALEALICQHSELEGRILDEAKSLHSHALAFINGQNTRTMGQPNPPLNEEDTVVLTPLVGGG